MLFRSEDVAPLRIRAPGYVVPLPAGGLALAALALWLGAWMVLAIPPAGRPRTGRAAAGGALSIGIVLLLAAIELAEREKPDRLAVLRGSRPLLEAPGSTLANARGSIGETGLVGAREGAWVRIALDGERSGWVPAASVLALTGNP